MYNFPNPVTSEDSYDIMNNILSLYSSGEADSMEIIYTNFISLV